MSPQRRQPPRNWERPAPVPRPAPSVITMPEPRPLPTADQRHHRAERRHRVGERQQQGRDARPTGRRGRRRRCARVGPSASRRGRRRRCRSRRRTRRSATSCSPGCRRGRPTAAAGRCARERDAEITITATPSGEQGAPVGGQHRPDAEVAGGLAARCGSPSRGRASAAPSGRTRATAPAASTNTARRSKKWIRPAPSSGPTRTPTRWRPAQRRQGPRPMAGRHRLDHEALPGEQERRPGHAAEHHGDPEQRAPTRLSAAATIATRVDEPAR